MYTLISQFQYCLIQSYYSTNYSLIQFWKPGKCISSIRVTISQRTLHWVTISQRERCYQTFYLVLKEKFTLKHPTHFSMATVAAPATTRNDNNIWCVVIKQPHSQVTWEWGRVLHCLVLFLTHWLSKWLLISVECTHSYTIAAMFGGHFLYEGIHYHNKLCSSPSLH